MVSFCEHANDTSCSLKAEIFGAVVCDFCWVVLNGTLWH